MSLREGPRAIWKDRQSCFFDSNILVYTDDEDEPSKQALALDLIDHHLHAGTGVISTQVLQEYYSVTTRMLGTEPGLAQRKVELFARLRLVANDLTTILAAIDLHRLHQLSFWDGLIFQAALNANCRMLLTEDMAHGASVRGIRIVNPFADLD